MDYSQGEIYRMLEGSYKKLKFYYFYDKTMLNIKKKIAEFEYSPTDMNDTFSKLTRAIKNEDIEYFDQLIKSIDFLVYPKSMDTTSDLKRSIVYSNIDHRKNIKKVNFFIDAPIELLIVDCLWTLFIAKIFHKDNPLNKNSSKAIKIGNKTHSTVLKKMTQTTYACLR